MNEKYTADDVWLVRNGERVLYVEGASTEAMAALVIEYQGQADAPKTLHLGPTPLASPTPLANITPRQIRMALTRAGLRASVEEAVAAGSQDLKDSYGFSTTFKRNNPQVIAMGEALHVSEKIIDDLWALGATL